MKRYLVFLSALGVSGLATAQSSVALFGILDATIAHGSGSLTNRTQLSRGGNATNRIGFRGVEDLGGGLSATFQLEGGFNVDDGTGAATNTNNQPSGATGGGGFNFNRRATVSLLGSWGEIRVGRDINPQYWGYYYGDPFLNVGVGTSVNFTQSITGVTNVRSSNSIAFHSSDLAGFKVSVMHYLGENASNLPDDGTGTGMRVSYANGPLSAGINLGRTKYALGNSVERSVDAQWKFDSFKLLADINRDSAGTLEAKGWSVGLSAPFGPHEFRAAISRHGTNAATSPRAKKIALGYVYSLSKRTAVYGTYAHVSNSGGSAAALNGSTTTPNASSKGFDLGLRHSF